MANRQISENARNWLRAISAAEGTTRNGQVRYDIMFGGGTFNDLSRHPDTVIDGGRYKSAAAGAYQFMPGTWGEAQRALGLKDFGPNSQDQAALYLMRRRGVDPDTAPINAKNVAILAPEWASLPTLEGKSYYGQPVVSLSEVQRAGNAPVTFQRDSSMAQNAVPPQQQATGSPPTPGTQPPLSNTASSDGTLESGSSNLQSVMTALNVLGGELNKKRSDFGAVRERGMKMLETPFEDLKPEVDTQKVVRDRLNREVTQGPSSSLQAAIQGGLNSAMNAFS